MSQLHVDENMENDSSDEYFSSAESDNEDDNTFSSVDCDSDDGSLHSGDESNDEFDHDFGQADDIHFTFGDTITKALILWAINFGISHTALSALLLILRRFGHEELPKLARTLLSTPRKAVEPRTCAPGEFFYRGIVYNTLQYDHEYLIETDTVEIDFFIDGLATSDSSKVKMWPIMGSFVNQPDIRPFVVGCYSGYGDPIDVDDFMKEFVEEIKELQENGIRVTKNEILKNFRFRCFIADAPARSFATGTMGHASYFGCPKCNQVCCGEGHKLYYQYFIGELRTDESFRDRIDIQHHKPTFQHRSSLLESVIGMVSQVVIEAMHAIDLGVTKRVCGTIFSTGAICSKMVPRALAVLQERFKSFRRYVPTDFARKPRNLKEISSFKATEFRQMLLYTLPVLLKNVVSPQLYSQVLKLHVAVRLLSDPKRYKENITAARKLINDFVNEYDDTIGKNDFTFYTHCLMHITDYVEAYGPLYSWSAYKYENHMRVIKRLLRRKHGHLKQFFNRVEEMRIADELLSGEKAKNECKFNSFNLEANSLRDGCVMVEPGYPLVITKSFDRNGEKMICGYRYNEFSDFYDDPVPSMENMGIILANDLSTTEEEFPATAIIHKFFRLPFEDQFTNMERLVLNKWILPQAAQSASSTTTNISQQSQSSTPYLQHTIPHKSTPKFKNSPLLQKSDPRKMKRNAPVANDNLNKNFQNASTSKSSENRKFAVPLSRPLNVKMIKPTPIVFGADSNVCEDHLSQVQKNSFNNKMPPMQSSQNISRPSINGTTSVLTKKSESVSHNFKVPPPRPLKVKMIKATPIVLGASNKCEDHSSPVQKDTSITSRTYPNILKKMSRSFQLNAAPAIKSVSNNSKENNVNGPSTSQPKVSNNRSLINIRTKNGLVPIPSNWKLKEVQPNVQTNVFDVNESASKGDTLPPKLYSVKGTSWNLYSSSDKTKIGKESFVSKKIPTHASPTTTNNREFGSLKSAMPVEPSEIIDDLPELESSSMTDRGASTEAIISPPGITQTQITTSQQLVTTPIQLIVPEITYTASNEVATDRMSGVQQLPSSPGESIMLDDDGDNGEPHAKKKKSSHEENEKNRKFDIILEELQKIKKREAKTSSKVNFIIQKLMDDDLEWKSFKFPIDDEAVYERFNECLANKRFIDKLDLYYRNLNHELPRQLMSYVNSVNKII